jgi:putative ABC transport system permease protein
MTVTMMIGLWIHDELTSNKYHKNYDLLVQAMIHQTFSGKTGTYTAIPLPLAEALRTDYSDDFEKVALASWNFEHLLNYGDQKIKRSGMFVEPFLPEMLTLDLIQGTYDDVLRNPNSILLSESAARALFGKEDPLHKTLKLDQKADVQVTGLFRDLPDNSHFKKTDLYLPWELYLSLNNSVKMAMDQWEEHSFQLFAQLHPAADIEVVNRRIKDVERNHNPNGNPEIFVHPMSHWHLYSEFKDGINIGGRIQFVWLFGIIGIFVLMLACINFMNLSTARSEKRAKEVGIRKTVGSMRWQLIMQFMTESLLVVMMSMVLALALVWFSIPWFNELSGKQMVFPWDQPLFWIALGGFTIFTGLLAGSYPAFYLSSFQPLRILKGTLSTGRSGSLPRKMLVVIQFTVSITLIIGTLVVFNQVQHAKNRPVGYDREGLLQYFVNRELRDKFELLRHDLLHSGAVHEMSQSSSPTTAVWSNQIGFNWEGKDPNITPVFGIIACSHEFGHSIGWQILEGRDFSRDFSTDTTALILNEAAVALTGLDNIVGKNISWDDKPYQVIGVVKDMIMESPYTPVKPSVFHINYNWANIYNIKLKPGMPVQDALATVRHIFDRHASNSVSEFSFADDVYNNKFRAEERIGKLARVFAILAVFISCLGLFGLSAFVAEQRTRELGIRKILGASITNLWSIQSKSFLILVVISCLLASPVAWYVLKNWLQMYEYRIELKVWIFVTAGLLVVAVTLLTVSFQSLKAALANPVKSLRAS